MKANFILGLIILLAVVLRLYNLGNIPSGFYNDESLDGYEAFSILKSGKDQYGNPLPINFKAFGDYRPGLFIYSLVPSIAIYGLNEFSVRLPSAVYSIILVIVTYFITEELFRKKRLSLFASMWISIVPFSMQFARITHDTNLATLLMSLGLLLYLKSKKNHLYLLLSAIIFSLSFYVYYTTRVIIPLLFIFILIKDFKLLRRRIWSVLISMVVSIVILLPIIFSLFNSPGSFFSRSNQVSIWGDKGLVAKILHGHQEDTYGYVSSLPKIFHNKIFDGFILVTKSLLNHFNLDFLVFFGDPDNLYKIPSFGIIYLLDLILIIIGLFCLFKYKNSRSIIVFWLIISLIPDTLTRLSPSSSRIHFILPPLAIIIALAVNYLSHVIGTKRKLIILFLTLAAFYLFVFSSYLHEYYNHLPVRYAREWHYGLKEIIYEINLRKDNYDKIWVSKTLWGWINFAFFLQYPPEKIQKEITLTDINEYGLGWVYTFDKYYFDYFPTHLATKEKILYVGEPGEFPKNIIPDKIIYYPDKSKAYYIVPSENIISENIL